MASRLIYPIFFFMIASLIFRLTDARACDFFQGNWVLDPSLPMYNTTSCPFIEREFNCIGNGRPDVGYIRYSWQPHGCNLARFDGQDFLRKMKGKRMLLVGDSLSRNQWKSLTCLLSSSVPNAKYTIEHADPLSTFTFTDYDFEIKLDRNVYLVDIVTEKIGRVLKLDSIVGGKLWTGYDVLIFNTWHWWNRRGPTQPWDYIEMDGKIMKDMDRMLAFERALETWASWVDSHIDPTKTLVFFQGISPSHYNGSDWDEPRAKTCLDQTKPLLGSTYPGGTPPALPVLKLVLSTLRKPVTLLDVTNLSLLRKDGHPSVYGLAGHSGMDCSHWCLPGVPDTWNQILYNFIK